MCLVVCLHTTYHFIRPGHINLEYIFYNTAVVAIPLFFMVSGYLLIGRRNVTYGYVLGKVCGIARFMIIVIGIWWVGYSLLHGWDINIYLSNLWGAFMQRKEFWMFWYFGALIIVYAVYPLINRLSDFPKYYIITLIIIGILQNIVFAGNLTGEGETSVRQLYRVWNWLFYFMLGGTLRHVTLGRLFLYISVAAAAVVNILVIRRFAPAIGSDYCEYFYSCPVVAYLSSCLFLLCTGLTFRHNSVIDTLSSLFLPVYTLHPFVISYLSVIIPHEWGGLVLFLSTLAVSVIISMIVMKTPYINKVFRI